VNQHLCGSRERNRTQRRLHHDACHIAAAMEKGMPWDKVTLNSEEIKPIALEICLAKGIS